MLRQWAIACLLAGSSACSSGYSKPRAAPGEFSQVFVNVLAWNDARVGAVLVDKRGRQTGWTDKPVRTIPGVSHGFGSDEGIPDENASDTAEALPDTAVGGTPLYHYFTILNDVATSRGLIDDGSCELRLVPVVAGKVELAITVTGPGFGSCKDTTSVWVKPGTVVRLSLSWKGSGKGCAVSIARRNGVR